jgi:AcrR family transcriptional regulator
MSSVLNKQDSMSLAESGGSSDGNSSGDDTPRRSYHHGNLRAHLMAAALEIVRETGTASLSLRDAARRAGVSHTAPYRHFRNRAALLAALAEEGFRDMAAEMQAARTAAGEDPIEQLRQMGLAYVRFAARHPGHFRVMFGPEAAYEHDHGVRHAGEAAYNLMRDALGQAEALGKLRDGDHRVQARTAWALMHGLAALIVDGRIPVVDDAALEALVAQSQRELSEGMSR